jgi:hypothetical protein
MDETADDAEKVSQTFYYIAPGKRKDFHARPTSDVIARPTSDVFALRIGVDNLQTARG